MRRRDWLYILVVLFILLALATCPQPFKHGDEQIYPEVMHVK